MVVHLEDEPRDVYLQLIAEDLNLGTAVEVTEISAESVRFLADGRKHFLPPLVAANASVAPLPQEEEMRGPFETLAVLRPRERGEVVRISASCHGLERRRLMDLGIVPGTVIRAEMKSPGGDPTAYRIRGALIALRRDQAAHIHITSRGEAA